MALDDMYSTLRNSVVVSCWLILIACSDVSNRGDPGRMVTQNEHVDSLEWQPAIEFDMFVRPDTLNLQDTITSRSTHLGFPNAIHRTDHGIILSDLLISPHIMFIPDAKQDSVVHFGRHGRGPSEFENPGWIVPAPGHPQSVWVFDLSNQQFSRVDFGGSEPRVAERIDLRVGRSLMSATWTNEITISAHGLFDDRILLELDGSGRIQRNLGRRLPFTEEAEASPQVVHANLRRVTHHPRRQRIAVAYQYISQIDILDLDHGTARSVLLPRLRERLQDLRGKRAYIDINSDSTIILAIHCGDCGRDEWPNEIDVFSWDEDLLCQLFLTPNVTLAIPSGGNEIIGVFYAEDYPYVGRWELPEACTPPS